MRKIDLIRILPMSRRRTGLAVLTVALLAGAAGMVRGETTSSAPKILPPAPVTAGEAAPRTRAVAILAGGCFWGVQGVFEHVRGVVATEAGYDGGAADTASYEQVSTGTTGHAETVRIVYDPARISYGELLRIFFSVTLDPTEKNRQGPDEGSQYRSVLFTTSPAQAREATAYIASLDAAHAFSRPIATAVVPDHGFHAAEAYHQDYGVLHPDNPYIAMWDEPKLDALRTGFPAAWRADPVTARPGAVTETALLSH